jgi:hypothetical protein
MAVRTYDPKQILVIVGGVPIGGYADGTFVKVSRKSDAYSMTTGCDGITSRAKSNDRSGSIVITLAQTSPSNKILTGFAVADEIANAGVVPVLIKDSAGDSAYVSGFAWVRKQPDGEFGKEVGNREWNMDAADLDIFTGGNLDNT